MIKKIYIVYSKKVEIVLYTVMGDRKVLLLIQQSMVAWQRYHTLKKLHFLAEYLFMLISLDNDSNYFPKNSVFLSYFTSVTIL